MRGAMVTVLSITAFIAVLLVFPGSSIAALQVVPACNDLLAGQNDYVGQVCISGDALSPVVTYTLSEEAKDEGWVFTEAHLWIGLDLGELPTNKAGNPVLGQFPYNSGDITGATEYVFELGSGIGGESEWCDETFYLAAHVKLQKDNGDGTFQTHSAWGDGDRIVEKGNWATYFTITITCVPDDFTCEHSETAFGDGDATLSSILGNNSWGWQIEYYPTNTRTTTIYAAAGKNDSNKGTEVGTLTISYDEEDGEVTVTYQMIGDFTLVETHLYVGTEWITDDQKGKGNYGYKHEELNGASSDAYTINISGSPIYIVAHAVVCGVFE